MRYLKELNNLPELTKIDTKKSNNKTRIWEEKYYDMFHEFYPHNDWSIDYKRDDDEVIISNIKKAIKEKNLCSVAFRSMKK